MPSQDLIAVFLDTYDYVWHRLRRRLDGLTDAEYLWEPVPECWTVRRMEDGRYRAHPGQWPETGPSPFTTIAWRMCHIADNFTEDRVARFFGRESPDDPAASHPATAAEGIAYVEHAYALWRSYLDALEDQRLWDKLGASAGARSERPLVRFILQYLEEFAHHAAEVAVVRDLYRAQP